ncbi:MAG: DUF2628 domain-containing protein [Acetobacteraceae bacterium]|nr:DUF2628 domain-containing protein [Acetobacteraceae bacterium]
MRTYTAHLKPGRAPVLVRESWSWGAFLFGPLWLLANRAWIPAALDFALTALLAVLLPDRLEGPVMLGLAIILGLLGRDLVRWSLDRRGYVLTHVLAARDEDGALGRLLMARRDLMQNYAEQLR